MYNIRISTCIHEKKRVSKCGHDHTNIQEVLSRKLCPTEIRLKMVGFKGQSFMNDAWLYQLFLSERDFVFHTTQRLNLGRVWIHRTQRWTQFFSGFPSKFQLSHLKQGRSCCGPLKVCDRLGTISTCNQAHFDSVQYLNWTRVCICILISISNLTIWKTWDDDGALNLHQNWDIFLGLSQVQFTMNQGKFTTFDDLMGDMNLMLLQS